MKRAMVVLSGGQDSTTCLYWAKSNFDEVHAVTFDYGQRHSIEIEASCQIAKMAEIKSHSIINVQNILRSRSPLTDLNAELETYTDFDQMEKVIGNRVELTFVPMRNAFFLTIAANIALSKNCYDLVTGVCEEDNANYPDCTAGFIDLQQATINKALGIDQFKIHTPLIKLSKAEIVKLAIENDAMHALAYSHTCYAGESPPCGKCHSCVLRAHGFEVAGVADPLVERFK